MQPTQDRGNLRALSRIGGFRRLLGVRLTSQYGDGLFQAALATSLLFNPAQRNTPLAIATGFAVLLVPFSLLGPYVGVFLDRWSRRTVIFVASMIRAGLAIIAAALLAAGAPDISFFLCALLIAAINRFFLSGLSASQPHVVPERLLVTSNAVAPTLGTAAYSAGLASTAVLLHGTVHSTADGYAVLVLAATAFYLCAGMIAWTSFTKVALGPDEETRRRGSILGEVAEIARGMIGGLRHLSERPQVAMALTAQQLCRTLYGVLSLAVLLLYSRYFYSDYTAAIGGLGAVVVAGSVGAVSGAFITPYATRRVGGRTWIIMMIALIGVTLPLLAYPYKPALLVLATFIGNISSQGIKIITDTNIQVQCAENYRGRIFALCDTVFNVLFVVGLFIGASVLPPDGHSYAVVACVAAGYLLLAVGYAAASRGRPPLEAPLREPAVATAG